eukprot:COSAG06_NODE_681_length_13133_cov_6.625547_2_plen_165_part_00
MTRPGVMRVVSCRGAMRCVVPRGLRVCGGRAVETMKQKHVVVQTNPNPSQSQAKPSQGQSQAKPRSQSQTLGTSTSRLSGGEGELRPQALCLRLPQTTTRPGQSAPSILLAGACLGKSIETRSRDSNRKNSKTQKHGGEGCAIKRSTPYVPRRRFSPAPRAPCP